MNKQQGRRFMIKSLSSGGTVERKTFKIFLALKKEFSRLFLEKFNNKNATHKNCCDNPRISLKF